MFNVYAFLWHGPIRHLTTIQGPASSQFLGLQCHAFWPRSLGTLRGCAVLSQTHTHRYMYIYWLYKHARIETHKGVYIYIYLFYIYKMFFLKHLIFIYAHLGMLSNEDAQNIWVSSCSIPTKYVMTSCFQFLKDGSLHGVTYVSCNDWIKLFFFCKSLS